MNLNSDAIRILCYGDSNTWGKIPGSKNDRYPVDQRWTGVLQAKLGDAYEVIEAGLNSRTTDLDELDPQKPGRNGLTFLMPTLEISQPQTVILFLGTNDLKAQYKRLPEVVALSLDRLIKEIQAYSAKFELPVPKILIVSPPLITEVRPELYAGAAPKSQQLASLYQRLADQNGCLFLDAAKYAQPSEVDGIHIEADGHLKLGEVIAQVLLAGQT